MQAAPPIRKRIVLVGGGHSHVTVLRAFGMKPEPGVGLTLIAKELDAPYSGMLPGFVAGHYTLAQCQIDLVRLAHFADARLIHGEAQGIDRARRHVLIKGRPPLAYDLLSIDTGITPMLDDIAGAAEHAIAVKPVSTFAPRWEALLARALRADGPRRIAVIGTGAAGFELALAMRHRLIAEAPQHGVRPDAFSFSLIGSGDLLPTHNGRARRLARRTLEMQGVTLLERDAARRIAPGAITLASGRTIDADQVLVTTKAAPPSWFAGLDLERDANGFLAARPTLQTTRDDDIFAVGDCASVLAHPREKAGVFAVRQGPPLTANLRRRAQALAAEPFTPQRQFLTLLALGGNAAIASRGPLAAMGAWAWTWKDRIDRAFMAKFQELPSASGMSEGGGAETPAMHCAGCASKLGPQALRNALSRLPPPPASSAVRDLAPGDDAALLDLGGPRLRLETADYFRALWPEPYVLGEIAAAHAMSDIVAKGGAPDHALALVQVPYAASRLQEDDLAQVMAGARAVFDAEGVSIVGGHSTQDTGLAAGFFVSGSVDRARVLRKSGLAAGDRLILTRPLGSGILFAAWMRRLARATDIAEAIAHMRRANAAAARVLAGADASAATDVTGFGLAGHLIEMLEGSAASALRARLDVTASPLYPGALELARSGVHSSLLPENLVLADRLCGMPAGPATLAILFDPQTSGGLLAGVPADRCEACLEALDAAGSPGVVIGTVVERAAAERGVVELTSTFD